MSSTEKEPKRPKREPPPHDIERVSGEELERLRNEKIPAFDADFPEEPPMPYDGGDLDFEP